MSVCARERSTLQKFACNSKSVPSLKKLVRDKIVHHDQAKTLRKNLRSNLTLGERKLNFPPKVVWGQRPHTFTWPLWL